VLLYNLLDLGLLKIRKLVFLHVQNNLGTTSEAWPLSVKLDGEASSGTRLPDVLLIIVGLGDDLDLVGNQVS